MVQYILKSTKIVRVFIMILKEVISAVPFFKTNYAIADIENIRIKKIEMDSRLIEQGDLFICIKGFTVDGHHFVDEAIKNGAVVIIAEKELNVSVPTIIVSNTSKTLSVIAGTFFQHPTNNMRLIGITGTNGKTTTTYLLEAIFNKHDVVTGIIGTIQMKIGNKSFALNNTTPDALYLQKTFRQMVNENVSTVVMEVSSHALDLGRVHGCDYNIAIFTNLSQDHLDYHDDMDDYLRAKSLLFSQLGNTYNTEEPKFAIINADDEAGELIKKSTAQHIITYGCKNESQIMATNINIDINQTSFTLKTPLGEEQINTHLTGMFNVYNMLAASSAAIVSGIPLSTIKIALEEITGIDGRFEQVNEGQNFAIIVDYAHTPESLKNVLETIKEFSNRNIYVVVGCGGDRDRTKRPLMAEIALKYANQAVFTSDNPRTEDPQSILDDMTNVLKDTHYDVIVDRKKAIYRAINYAEENDVVLIAGKGHETYQQIDTKKYDFDDREIARRAIRSKEI